MEQKWKKWKQRVYSGSTAGVQVRGDGKPVPGATEAGTAGLLKVLGVRTGSNCQWIGFEAERNRQMLGHSRHLGPEKRAACHLLRREGRI